MRQSYINQIFLNYLDGVVFNQWLPIFQLFFQLFELNYCFLYLFILCMKIIINEGFKKYQEKGGTQRSQLQKFIQSHRFYNSSMDVGAMITRLENGLKKNHQLGSRSLSKDKQYSRKESFGQLSLYLNKGNNKQIFTLFELITSQPKGITYESLSRKLKTDIITISHYCCKLKKLRLIDWGHEKQGIVVFPKLQIHQKQEKEIKYSLVKNEVEYDFKGSFLFRELGMIENIWINISSEESISKGGINNEEIKRKIMKHSQNKMVRRTVESMKFFEKNAERQGKVFEFKYRNETEQIKDEIIRTNQAQYQIQILNQLVQDWMQAKFPEFQGENFLLDLINNKFKDYISSLGIKQSKRQCTPLKLNRYIKVLNYLHKQGGMRENELRNLIVKDEKQLNNNIGIMHKRSLLGILEGLKNLHIIYEEEGFYFPSWVEWEKRSKRKQVTITIKKPRQDGEEPPKKRNHVDLTEKLKNENKKAEGKDGNPVKFKRISEKKYRLELLIALLNITLDKALKKLYRKAFNRIVYVERKKGTVKYTPQSNVLYLLEDSHQLQKCTNQFNHTLESFYKSLDDIIEEKGRKEDPFIDAENELIKFIRKNPIKNSNSLRIKYGKNWRSKFQDLQEDNIIEIDEEKIQISRIETFLI